MVDALKSAASCSAADVGITYLSQGFTRFDTYAGLLAAARNQLGGLQKLGLSQGSTCVMQISDMRSHIHALWGCILGGIAPVNISIPRVYEPRNGIVQKLLGLIETLEAQHVLASTPNVEPLRHLLRTNAEGRDTAVHDLARLDASAPAVSEPHIRSTDILFYQLTSGSTGRSKCIPECHCAVISHLRHSIAHCGYSYSGCGSSGCGADGQDAAQGNANGQHEAATCQDTSMNWLPFDHVVPMLTFHLCDVYACRRAFQVPTAEVLSEPLLWVRVLAEYGCTHSWAPNFGFKLVVKALQVCITTRTCTCMRA